MSKVARALALWLLLAFPPALVGQVGYDPSHSPYRPITARMSLMAAGSYVWGSSGKVGVGPADGLGGGLRYEMRLTGPADAFAGVSWNRLQRLVADPAAPADSQLSGPADQNVWFVDAGLAILLAGDKTWRRLAPYVGANLGLAFGEGAPGDSSGYEFSTKFVTGPLAGVRLYLSDAVSFRVEGRLQFWKLSYPDSFFLPPERAPDDPPLLDPLVTSDTEWTSHPSLFVGLAYSFRL
jgi:hypothetical protein